MCAKTKSSSWKTRRVDSRRALWQLRHEGTEAGEPVCRGQVVLDVLTGIDGIERFWIAGLDTLQQIADFLLEDGHISSFDVASSATFISCVWDSKEHNARSSFSFSNPG